MSALAIARVELRRFLRDRSNVFFVFVLPLLLVAFIGAQFAGGGGVQLGLVGPDDAASRDLVADLEDSGRIEVIRYDDAETFLDDVSRARLSAGVVLPDAFGTALDVATPVEVGVVARPDAASQSLRRAVDAAVAAVTAPADAAAVAASVTGRAPSELVAVARDVTASITNIEVAPTDVGDDPLAAEFAGLGTFDLGASSQLFLFVFLTSLASGAALIQSRQLGMVRRMLATRTAPTTVIGGHLLGRFAIAVTQAAYIIVATWLLFQVNWGDPLGTTILVALFCFVAAGAGMLVGVVFRNESQAAGAGVGLGLVLAALGGSMAPLEIFPPAMQRVAMATPHGWANTAIAELVRRGGGVAAIATELTVLALYAVVLISLAALTLRRSMGR